MLACHFFILSTAIWLSSTTYNSLVRVAATGTYKIIAHSNMPCPGCLARSQLIIIIIYTRELHTAHRPYILDLSSPFSLETRYAF